MYKAYKVKNEDYFYCYKCQKHHKAEEIKFFYNVVVGEFCMANSRSCSLEFANEIAESYNERHERIKAMSADKNNPILV